MAEKATQTLAERIKELPPETREAAAYAAVGDGMDRAKFRDAWLAERVPAQGKGATLGPQPQGETP